MPRANNNQKRAAPFSPVGKPSTKFSKNNNPTKTEIVKTENVLNKPLKSEDPKIPPGLRLLTGSIERVLYMAKKEPTALYEIFCTLVDNRPGVHIQERKFTFKNNSGREINGTFYDIDGQSPQLEIGQLVRVIGRIRTCEDVHVLKIRQCSHEDITMAKRLETISTFVVSNMTKNK